MRGIERVRGLRGEELRVGKMDDNAQDTDRGIRRVSWRLVKEMEGRSRMEFVHRIIQRDAMEGEREFRVE